MQFTDSHCHLDFPELSKNLPQLLQQCANNNIKRIIVPAVYPEHWQRVISLHNIKNHSDIEIACALGIHPWFLINHPSTKQTNKQLELYHKLLAQTVNEQRKNLIAIGECGIDVFKAKKNTDSEQTFQDNLKLQQDFFEMQLSIAKEKHLPVIVHHCQSHHYILPILKQYRLEKAGVIHAFSGSYQQAKSYIDLGFKLGIGGTITYSRAKKTINAIKRLPIESLLLETDAPAMPPSGKQGEINTPLSIINIFQAITSIRTESALTLSVQLEDNSNQLFFSDINSSANQN